MNKKICGNFEKKAKILLIINVACEEHAPLNVIEVRAAEQTMKAEIRSALERHITDKRWYFKET